MPRTVLGSRLTQPPYSWAVAPLPLLLNHVCICVIRVIRGELLLRCEGTNDFFEARIAAERIP